MAAVSVVTVKEETLKPVVLRICEKEMAGPHPQRLWLTALGVGSENLHFSESSSVCQCYGPETMLWELVPIVNETAAITHPDCQALLIFLCRGSYQAAQCWDPVMGGSLPPTPDYHKEVIFDSEGCFSRN